MKLKDLVERLKRSLNAIVRIRELYEQIAVAKKRFDEQRVKMSEPVTVGRFLDSLWLRVMPIRVNEAIGRGLAMLQDRDIPVANRPYIETAIANAEQCKRDYPEFFSRLRIMNNTGHMPQSLILIDFG